MRIYQFANFKLDEAERTLSRDGEAVQLAPKVFDTLVVLVKNHNRLVTKDALMEEVWRDTFVEENNLTQYIFVLRRVLSENNNGSKFIETVPRRGYRFVADVRETDEDKLRMTNDGLRNGSVAPTSLPMPMNPPIENHTSISSPAAVEASRAEDAKISPVKFRQRAILISVFSILVVAAGASFVLRQTPKAWSPENLKFKRLTESGDLFGAAISPDGNSLVYVVRGKRNEVRLKNIQTESEIVVARADAAQFGSPLFSPDGNFIYYAFAEQNANAAAFQVPLFGGEPRRIAENLYSEFSVSPDGKQIAFPRKLEAEKKHVIVVADTNGSGERVAATCDEPDYFELWGPAPAWSPDGERLVVSKGAFGAEGKHLIEIDLRNGLERELNLQDRWRYFRQLNWANDNELIIAAQKEAGEKTQLWQITFPDGAATRVTNDSNEYEDFNFTKNASRIVAMQSIENFHLWLFDREISQARQLTFGENHRDGLEGAAFTPDNRILYTMREKNEFNIFSMNADGGDVRQLTKHAGRINFDPVASPDNQFIAFTSDRGGTRRLWLMNTDGSGAKQLSPASDDKETEEDCPYFSPDGRWIYYTFYQSGRGSIYKISIDGGEPVEVRRDATVPVVSPDGKEIAVNFFNDKAAKPWQLRVQSLDGAKDENFDFPALFLKTRWLPDTPRTLVTADTELDGNNLWRTNYASGERRQITDFKAERIDRFDVSKDGRFFVIARGSDLYDAVLIER